MAPAADASPREVVGGLRVEVADGRPRAADNGGPEEDAAEAGGSPARAAALVLPGAVAAEVNVVSAE